MDLKSSDIKFLINVLDEIEESNSSKPIANIISKKLNKMFIPQKINEEELDELAKKELKHITPTDYGDGYNQMLECVYKLGYRKALNKK